MEIMNIYLLLHEVFTTSTMMMIEQAKALFQLSLDVVADVSFAYDFLFTLVSQNVTAIK